MKKLKYSKQPLWIRWVSLLVVVLLVGVFLIPILTSPSDVVESPSSSSTAPPVPETVPAPEWESIDIPLLEYIELTDLVTIYDVSDAIKLIGKSSAELEDLLNNTEPEHPQYEDIQECYDIANSWIENYYEILDDHWKAREKSRPVMTAIWRRLIEHGMSAEVTAGILGNMLAESGGCGWGDINPYNWDNATGCSYYGICQWSIKWTPHIANTDLTYQLDHLISTYDRTFQIYGRNYEKRYGADFSTEQFLAMTDPYEAAIAFAVVYERCHKNYVEHRGPLADQAYEYFTVLNSWPWPG